MMKRFKNKTFIAGISIALAALAIVTAVVLTTGSQSLPTEQNGDSSEPSSEVHVKVPASSATEPSGTGKDTLSDGSALTVGTGPNNPNTTKAPKSASAKAGESARTGTKTPDKPDNTVSIGTGNNTGSDPKSPSDSTGGVISIEPVPRGEEPSGASGIKPQSTDWVSINSGIPQELYKYDYTIVNKDDLLTGKQVEWRGFRDWEKAANAAIGALTRYYTIDYRKITSTNPNDRDKYLTDLVYWTGESAYLDICDYMQTAINKQIISTASVVTDGSLIYNNGVRLIRARVYVTWQSGAGFYGLQSGVKYYKDVEVAVYAATGEDRYGFGACNEYNALLFSNGCLNTLCAWKKA